MSSAEILTFPGGAQPPRGTGRPRPLTMQNYELDRLAETAEGLAAAQLDVAAAIRWVRSGRLMTEDNAAMSGEALHSILSSAIALARLMGCRTHDRAMLAEIESWIDKREKQA